MNIAFEAMAKLTYSCFVTVEMNSSPTPTSVSDKKKPDQIVSLKRNTNFLHVKDMHDL